MHPTDHIEIIETRDGSKTLYDAAKEVHYRNIHGAKTESRFVFVDGSGITQRSSPWRVLELGFGAGVNFVQTALACLEREDTTLEYHSVDHRPVAPELLAFHLGEVGEMAREALGRLEAGAGRARSWVLGGRIELSLYRQRWLDFGGFGDSGFEADAVYFDPFGPRTEPDSWTSECFEVASRHMSDAGVLATYSAATGVRRAMFEAHLWAAKADGPGKKREITFAARHRSTLAARETWKPLSRAKYLEEKDDG